MTTNHAFILLRRGKPHQIVEVWEDGLFDGLMLVDGIRYKISCWATLLKICDRHDQRT